ncbi:hypothetical protein NT05LM_3348, partial [Listeria marthii FSL S4-120]
MVSSLFHHAHIFEVLIKVLQLILKALPRLSKISCFSI